MPAAAGPNTKVRVVGRIRPLSATEEKRGAKETLISLVGPIKKDPEVYTEEPEMIQVTEGNGKKRYYELDAVFDKNCTQREVYVRSGCSKAVREDLFTGYNCTVLAYGQTGAGKSFSMGTASHGSEIGESDGMIPRACHDLFETIRHKCDGNAKVFLQYIEIYNEELRDLLVDDKHIKPLKIRERLDGEVYVSGLEARRVSNPKEIGVLMEEASTRRVTAATKMNAVSSRSHAMCVLRIEGVVENKDEDGSFDKFSSMLTLVDLAGSERASKTGATGERLKEGININKSLLVLGQVVSALAAKDRKRAWKPPYRDSKLTRLLQDSLGGNSQTIMVACVSPADYNTDESISTMKYATSARNIKNTATKNLIKNISPEEAAKLQRENELLKKQVKELQATIKEMEEEAEASGQLLSEEEIQEATQEEGIEAAESAATEAVETEKKPTKNDDPAAGNDDSKGGKNDNDDDEKEDDGRSSQRMVDDEKEKNRMKQLVLSRFRENVQRRRDSSLSELPQLKMELQQLREEVKQKNELEKDYHKLQDELDEAKTDAEHAQRAAARLSDMLEKLDRSAETRKNKANTDLESKNKEIEWLTFVSMILDSCVDDVKKIAPDFDRVMSIVHDTIASVVQIEPPATKAAKKKNGSYGDPPPKSRRGFFGFGSSDDDDDDNENENENEKRSDYSIARDAMVYIGMMEERVTFFTDGVKTIVRNIEQEANNLRETMVVLEKETDELKKTLRRENEYEKAAVMSKGRFQKRFGDR